MCCLGSIKWILVSTNFNNLELHFESTLVPMGEFTNLLYLSDDIILLCV